MRKKMLILFSIGAAFSALLYAPLSQSASVVGSKHDLSTPTTPEPCGFCHTPHFANQALAPLWNRAVGSGVTFTMYTSPTMDSPLSNTPSGISLACLGCHDGVGAPIDAYNDDKHGVLNAPGSGGMPDRTSDPNCERCHPDYFGSGGPPVRWLGTDLRKSHPISMTYPTAAQDPAFFTPPNTQKGWSEVPLYSGKVECPSCHNVHDKSISPFLRIVNTGSALCYKCHNK